MSPLESHLCPCPGTTLDLQGEAGKHVARRDGAFYFLTLIRSTGRAQPDEYKPIAEGEGDGKQVQHQGSGAPKSGEVVGMTFTVSGWDVQTTCCCVWGRCVGTGLWAGKDDKGLGLGSDKQTKTSTFHCAHHEPSAPNELLATLWTEGRQCWEPWAGAGGAVGS